MAEPKKKVSRSRRDQRRHSPAYKLDAVTGTKCPHTQNLVRTHTVSMQAIREGTYQPRAKKASTTAA
jgi:ribosomal protein L32